MSSKSIQKISIRNISLIRSVPLSKGAMGDEKEPDFTQT